MSVMASQITGNSTDGSTACPNKRKENTKTPALLAICGGNSAVAPMKYESAIL